MSPVIDEMQRKVIDEHEKYVDLLVGAFTDMRDKDRAEGARSDDAALGGMVMIMSEGFTPTSLRLIASLAVRRLAEVVTR